MEAAYKALKRKGKVKDDVKFITFGGDGGTYDIGFQSLSGAMERGHDMTYVCYDNEAYMNTGIQRSSSTPRFANATTTPVGTVIPGKTQNKKNLTDDHGGPRHRPMWPRPPSSATSRTCTTKAHKAIYTPGPSFLNVHGPLPPWLASTRRRSCRRSASWRWRPASGPSTRWSTGEWHPEL